MELIYKGMTLKPGQKIKGSIEGIEMEGHLQYEGGWWYFCQDVERGKSCDDMLGHKYSWVFQQNSDGSLTYGVEIFTNKLSSNNMTIIEKMKLALMGEPEKTLTEAGIIKDGNLTEEGTEVYLAWKFQEDKAKFTEEIVKKITDKK